MSTVTVYGPQVSTCTARVLFTAFELGHPVNLIPIDLQKGEQKQPSHVARQPFGKVPVATDGDFTLYESRAICRYLVDKYADEPTIKLTPPSTDIKKRAVFEQWMSLEATTYTPEVTTLLVGWMHETVYNKPFDKVAIKQATDNLKRDGAVLNKQLEGQQYIANNEFSLVDICLVTYLFPIAEESVIKEWFGLYPNIGAWYKTVTSRPAFKQITDMHKW